MKLEIVNLVYPGSSPPFSRKADIQLIFVLRKIDASFFSKTIKCVICLFIVIRFPITLREPADYVTDKIWRRSCKNYCAPNDKPQKNIFGNFYLRLFAVVLIFRHMQALSYYTTNLCG